jgi:hypothetical protein
MNLDLSGYDFVDFGAGKGGSMRFAQRVLRGHSGLAIDKSESKVSKIRELGFDAAHCDATKVEPIGTVRFSLMSHFLEHLPSLAVSLRCLRTAVLLSTEFVYIQQPWFGSDAYLEGLGLKLYWSDWHGHRNHMQAEHLTTYLEALRLERRIAAYTVWSFHRVEDSSDPCLLPLSAPPDQFAWDAEAHASKPLAVFNQPVFRELRCFISVSDSRSVSRQEQRILKRGARLGSAIVATTRDYAALSDLQSSRHTVPS